MIRAALFDLDGTLLNSMRVWLDVDKEFFAARRLELPTDYSRSVNGMSYMETAAYTKKRFALDESVEEIAAEWTRMARREYAERVLLKPGAYELLSDMSLSGVKLAVVTALLPELYRPCLERNRVLKFFDCEHTVDGVRARGKRDGAIYMSAAAELGVAPGECAVFEDVLDGVIGAKKCGMRAYCAFDAVSTHELERIQTIADGVIYDFSDFDWRGIE